MTERLAFGISLAGVIVVQAIFVWSSVTQNPFWEDEGFNLTVPVNLLQGLGYASDGVLSGSTLIPFDPRISTGPVVLLPIAAVLATGADLVVGSRLVPAAFYLALLVAVWLIGRRVGGRWAGLAAVCVPMAFDATAPPSPLQGPADVLGEVPAAALLAWALYVLRRRPWLAGLLVGLAIQAKYISLLAVPAFVLAYVLRLHGVRWAYRLRALLVPGALVVAPTALVELVVFATLGPAGYVEHVRETARFMRSGGQVASTTVGEKLLTFGGSWHLTAWVVLVVTAVLAWVVATAAVTARRDPALRARALANVAPPRDQLQTFTVAALGALTFIAWWATASHTPLWVRHPAPGVLAFVPVLAAFVVLAVRVHWTAGGMMRRLIATPAAAMLVVVLTMQLWQAASVSLTRTGEGLAEQREVAAGIATLGHDRIATDWGRTVSIVVMSGARVALVDAPPDRLAGLPRLHRSDSCGEAPPLLAVAPYVVCAP